MRRGDLFVLSWESLRRVEWGKVSSFLSMSGGGLFNSLLIISSQQSSRQFPTTTTTKMTSIKCTVL